MIDFDNLAPMESSLYFLGSQDMPVGGDEIWDAIQDYREEILDLVLFGELIEQHRPVVTLHNVRCPACGSDSGVDPLNDVIPECKFWARAKFLGLVS